MKKPAVFLSFYIFFLCFSCLAGQKYYSIQVTSNPTENRKASLSVYQKLHKEGFPAYCELKEIKPDNYVDAVKIGVFDSFKEADEFGKKFKKSTGMDYFVDFVGRVYVDKLKSGKAAVTTPHEVWYKDGNNIQEVAVIKELNEWQNAIYSLARISPDGNEIAYFKPPNLCKYNIINKKTTILKKGKGDDFEGAQMAWSYDGKYIAYQDARDFEFPTSLWVIDADGKNDRILVNNSFEKPRTVDAFIWDPEKDLIYYNDDKTYGTQAFGEKIYKVDMSGKSELILPIKGKRKIYDEFRVENGKLFYKYYRFDNNGKIVFSTEYSEKID